MHQTSTSRAHQKVYILIIIVVIRFHEFANKAKCNFRCVFSSAFVLCLQSMLGSLDRDDVEKMKCVYLTDSDQMYASPSLLFQQPICLSDSLALYKLVKFISNLPTYLQPNTPTPPPSSSSSSSSSS